MSRSTLSRPPEKSEPAWDIARLFPDQGEWSEDDYLSLDTNHLVEYADGRVHVLPMPTTSHQDIVAYLFTLLASIVNSGRLGKVLFAPLRVRVRRRKYREPDVVFMLAEHADRIGEKFWRGADLVIEVVSDDRESHERDYVQKRKDYAAAGVAEYWIVDPQMKRITVLRLAEKNYEVHEECVAKGRASSALVKGFAVDAETVFALP